MASGSGVIGGDGGEVLSGVVGDDVIYFAGDSIWFVGGIGNGGI